MNVNIKISKKVFNDVYLPYLDNDDRYLIFYGGGSSGKSYYIAQRFIYRLIQPIRHNFPVSVPNNAPPFVVSCDAW